MITPRDSLPTARAGRVSAALVGLVLAATPGRLGAEEARPQWDHRCIETPRAEDLEPVLNRWGEDGWELAAAVPANSAKGTDLRLCLKRLRLASSNTPRACRPACGEGNYCLDGKCVACVPTCRADEQCAANGICMARNGSGGVSLRDAGASAVDAVQWQPTREELNTARAILQPSADRCAAATKEEGQLVVSMTILGGGTVTAAKAKMTSLSDRVQRCVEDAARALRFRGFRAALVAIDMPITVHGKPATPSKLGD